MKFEISEFFENLLIKFNFHYNPVRTGHLTWKSMYIYYIWLNSP